MGRLLGFISVLASITGVGVVAYFAWSVTATSPPVYEESRSIPSELNVQINRINLTLYECLYREKIPEKNILFLAVEPRHERGKEWEFAEVLIRLPQAVRIKELERVISDKLSALGHGVQHRNVRSAGGDSIIDLFALGHFTHRIKLVGAERQKTAKPEKLPLIAIIIDDLGYDLKMARSFMDVGVPLTLSIIPNAPYTTAISKLARERGCELMLHLPMEPKNYPQVNPGPGAILAEMKDETITAIIEDHLRRLPGVRGVNNHMGSRLTEMEESMGIVFRELKKRDLFYVDSRTTEASVASTLGKKTGVSVGARSVFLDHHPSAVGLKVQTERLIGMARSEGGAIAIGHPHKETLVSLKASLEMIKQNAKIVPVSELLQHTGAGRRDRIHGQRQSETE